MNGDLLSLIFYFTISAMLTPGLLSMQHDSFESIRASSAAGQMTEIAAGANQYVKDNYQTLIANKATQTITVAQLQAAGDLSSAVLPVNPYGQQWVVQISQPVAGKLQAVINTVGGTPIKPTNAAYVAAQTKGIGGFIPYPNQVPGASSNDAVGAYGGWKISMAGYTNGGPGHLVGLLSYSQNGQLNNDYLYRHSIPGQPQLNTMQTNINMGGNSGTDATSYQVTGGGELDSDQGGSLELGGNNTTAGSGAPYIDFHRGGDGTQDYNVRVQNDKESGLSITGANGQGSLDVQGRIGAEGEPANSGYPQGWGGGIHTWDLYANGAIGSGGNGNLLADLTGNGGQGGSVTTSNPNWTVATSSTSNSGSATTEVKNAWGAYAYMSAPNDGSNNGASVVTNGNMQVVKPYGGQSFYAYNNGYAGVTDTFQVGSKLELGTAFGSANPGWGCSPNGEIAANANGSGELMSCVDGRWKAAGSSGFTQTYQMGVSNGTWYRNNGSTPMFLASSCGNTYNGSGGMENVQINVFNQGGQQVADSRGQVAEGGSDANLQAAPSASAIVPPGYYFAVNGFYMYSNGLNCSLMVTR